MALTRPRAYQIYDIDYKQATRVVTVSNITLSGGAPSQVDGVNLSLNDRVLVTGQSTLAENGIYYVTTVGAGANGTWARSSDTNTTGELLSGTIVMVTEGNTYADTQWKLTTDNPIVIGVSSLVFVQNYLANTISSGNSNVEVNANSTIDFSVAGVADVLVVTSFGANVAGYVSATGNVTGNYIFGNGSQLTGLPEGYSNANVDSHLAAFGSNTISTTGNITGGYFIGNGSTLTSLTGANVTGTVANATYATTSGTATSATTANTVTTNAQPNITSVGILTSVSVSGNTTSGNVLTSGLISATGNITGNYILGNGSQLTGLPATYGNTEVAAYLPTYTGNLSPGNLTTSGLISAGGNITGGNVSGTNLTGTLATAAQTNITSVGTLSSLSVSGNVQGGNLQTAGLISATGGITGNTLLAGGISLTGNAITSTNTTITIDPNSAGGVDGAVIIAGNLSVQGNVTYIDSNVITTNEKSITLANNVNTGSAADGAGIDIGNNTLAYWRFNNATTSWQSNIGLTPAANATLNLGGTSNYWATVYATGVSVSGTVTGASVVGGVMTGTSLSTSGNVTGGNVLTSGLISVTGNITAGNLLISGAITDSAQLDIQTSAGNANIVLTPNGSGNVNTGANISATGNVIGNILNATSGLVINSNTISANYTLPSNYNAMSAGPITIDALGNVNVGTGQRWTIV